MCLVNKKKARAAEEAARLTQAAILVELATQQADTFFQVIFLKNFIDSSNGNWLIVGFTEEGWQARVLICSQSQLSYHSSIFGGK